jgi:hypothetical protein
LAGPARPGSNGGNGEKGEQHGRRKVTKQPAPANPEYRARLAHYEEIVSTIPGLVRKGDANPYTAFNGNMSSYLHPRGEMALRLPPGLREQFLVDHQTALFEAYGVVQKEYVAVPDALLADTGKLAPYFKASCDYVAGLPPKPTGKRKAK